MLKNLKRFRLTEDVGDFKAGSTFEQSPWMPGIFTWDESPVFNPNTDDLLLRQIKFENWDEALFGKYEVIDSSELTSAFYAKWKTVKRKFSAERQRKGEEKTRIHNEGMKKKPESVKPKRPRKSSPVKIVY
jgi:hypothetical protein